MGTQLPPPKKKKRKGHSPQFLANVRCGQIAGWTKMPLCVDVGLGLGNFVFDGAPPLPEKKCTAPTQFLAHVYCGQMTGWIKMPLVTEVNLGPGDVVLDGVAALPHPPKRGTALSFSPCLLWPNCWMDEDVTWYGSRPWPRPYCVRWEPSSPHKGAQHPLFAAHVCCGHCRPSQLLLSCCKNKKTFFKTYHE